MGATGYVWDFGDGTAIDVTFEPSHTYNDFGLFTVTLAATDAAGCTDVATLVIDVTAESDVSIPNIFSPNNDNVNDMFKAQAANLKNLHGEIFNRWCQKLFEWEGTKAGWDGHASPGEVAPSGTYFYIITAVGADDTPDAFKGYVTFAR
jgi:gliding motility-associated-like protein